MNNNISSFVWSPEIARFSKKLDLISAKYALKMESLNATLNNLGFSELFKNQALLASKFASKYPIAHVYNFNKIIQSMPNPLLQIDYKTLKKYNVNLNNSIYMLSDILERKSFNEKSEATKLELNHIPNNKSNNSVDMKTFVFCRSILLIVNLSMDINIKIAALILIGNLLVNIDIEVKEFNFIKNEVNYYN